jgi:hypothetical protein
MIISVIVLVVLGLLFWPVLMAMGQNRLRRHDEGIDKRRDASRY